MTVNGTGDGCDEAGAALEMRYDAEAGALYLRLGGATGPVAETVEIEEMVYMDLDADARPIGVEFVVAQDLLPFLMRQGGAFVLPTRLDDRPEALAEATPVTANA